MWYPEAIKRFSRRNVMDMTDQLSLFGSDDTLLTRSYTVFASFPKRSVVAACVRFSKVVDEQPDSALKTPAVKGWAKAYRKEDCRSCSARLDTIGQVLPHQQTSDGPGVAHRQHPVDSLVAF